MRTVGKFGGSRTSETSTPALRWFEKHQSLNGMWDVITYCDHCGENQTYEPGTVAAAEI